MKPHVKKNVMILRIATTSLFPKLVLVKCGRLVVGKNLLDGEENYFSNKVNQLLEAHLHIKICGCVCIEKNGMYLFGRYVHRIISEKRNDPRARHQMRWSMYTRCW